MSVQQRQVYEAVLERIKNEIRSGQLKAGDKLAGVRDLALSYGVGQGSIREAVRVLSYMGLLRVKHGGGIFVTEMASQLQSSDSETLMTREARQISLRHLIELRLMIEPVAARLAAERGTPAEHQEIQRLCSEVEAFLQHHVKAFQEQIELQEKDIAFHMAILQAAHNPLLLDVLEHVRPQLRAGRRITAHVPHLVEGALHFHQQITHAILAHDIVRAENFMRAHLEDMLWWLETYDENRGEQRKSEASMGRDMDQSRNTLLDANLTEPSGLFTSPPGMDRKVKQ